MKNKRFTFCKSYSIILFLLGMGVLGNAQSVPAGISFQAALNDEQGHLIKNKEVQLRISLTGPLPIKTTYYVETHLTKTSDQGTFSIVIGQGESGQDIINRVPWATDNIWLNIELLRDDKYKFINQSELLAVPFAFHAQTANELSPSKSSDLRTDQNITWNTSGNFKTEPDVHYLGTADSKDLYFKTHDTTRMVIFANGQTVFYTDPDITGGDVDKSAYPVIIEGGRQGMYIQIEESRDNTNNFMTFADNTIDPIHGAVEGQTVGEFFDSFEFKYFIATNTADVVLGGINGALGVVEAGGMTAAGKAGAAITGKKAILKGIFEEIRFKLFRIAKFITQNLVNIGVYYKSGSADYAEWLERAAEEEPMTPGEVVGLKNGKISRNTEEADHLLVISRSPIVLGNMPQEEEKKHFEKVAMKGQVEVFCVGEVNVGDYILPSGNNDGMAIALAPGKMKAGDYARIVGVAWGNSFEAPINRINVAVGINHNDLTAKIEELDDQISRIQDYLKGNIDLQALDKDESNNPETFSKGSKIEKSSLQPQLSDAQYDRVIDLYAENYRRIFSDTQSALAQEGTDVASIPYLKTMFDDPITYLKSLRRDPQMKTHMGLIDQVIIESKILDQKN